MIRGFKFWQIGRRCSSIYRRKRQKTDVVLIKQELTKHIANSEIISQELRHVPEGPAKGNCGANHLLPLTKLQLLTCCGVFN